MVKSYVDLALKAAGVNGKAHAATPKAPAPKEWDRPHPLGASVLLPDFPTQELPPWMGGWVADEAEATQTPPDLAAMLSLSEAGAGLAKKVRVSPRPGWNEPTNIFCVTALPPGERKSAVFTDAMRPVQEYEVELQEMMAPIIAEAEAEKRMLEARMKVKEGKAAKSDDDAERDDLKTDAKELAKELANFKVPAVPQLFCDDITPAALGKLLADQGGRMLLAAAEGTAFEIAKGRYSETADFEIFLKGHAGDPLRVHRIGREKNVINNPALSVALAVQPDVLRGLADEASMRGRGFLARFLYSLPNSKMGARLCRPETVPGKVAGDFFDGMTRLWKTEPDKDQKDRPCPHLLRYSPDADDLLLQFMNWLEPQLAPDEALARLAGWAQKLAGAIVRISAILHVADAIGESRRWQPTVDAATVQKAILIGRDYLLPHAGAAFGMMQADEKVEDAKRVVTRLIAELSEKSEGGGPVVVKRSEIHEKAFGGSREVDEVVAVVELLVKHGYLDPVEEPIPQRRGRRPSDRYEINPRIRELQTSPTLSGYSENSEK